MFGLIDGGPRSNALFSTQPVGPGGSVWLELAGLLRTTAQVTVLLGPVNPALPPCPPWKQASVAHEHQESSGLWLKVEGSFLSFQRSKRKGCNT